MQCASRSTASTRTTNMMARRITTGRIGANFYVRTWPAVRSVSLPGAVRSLSDDASITSSVSPVQCDPSLVDPRHAPAGFHPSYAVVYRDFITPYEAEVLTKDVLARMKRRRYEKGHWDAVITGYKEVEMHNDSFSDGTIPQILERTRKHLEAHLYLQSISQSPVHWLPCHAIDLKKQGELKAHVDSVRFSGGLVAGISLLSSSIMRLVPDDSVDEPSEQQQHHEPSLLDRGYVDLHLPPNSLYALTGDGRYSYSHQLLPDSSVFQSSIDGTETIVRRDHRLSIIFRDAKSEGVNQ